MEESTLAVPPTTEELDISLAKTTGNAATSSTAAAAAEDSLEAKYTKLKHLAVRLKRNVAEKSEEIERLKEENSKISGKSLNVSTIQLEFDKALDEIERLKRLESSLQKDLKATVEDNLRLKETNIENHSFIQILTSTNKSLTEKADRLDKLEEENQKLRIRADELENELKEYKLTHVDAQQEKRQTAMLSLEITDYEKKLTDANDRLEEQQKEIASQLQNLVDKDKKIQSLESSVTELETCVNDLKKNREQLQADIGRKSEKLNFLQDEMTKLNEKLSEKKAELTKLAREYENSKLSFSSESNSLVEKCNGLLQMLSQHEHKISVLEENRRSRESQISNLKLELSKLESDYSNYKVKAQAMLKSQKPFVPQTQEPDDLVNLQKIVQDFHSEIAVLKSDMQTLRLENENLSMERAELGFKLSQLKTDSVERDVNSGNQLQKLKQELRQKDIELKESQAEAKIDREAVVTAYKVQLEAVKAGYESRIKAFEAEVIALKSTINAGDYSPNVISSRSEETLTNGGGGDARGDSSSESLRIRRLMMGPGAPRNAASPARSPLDQPLVIETSGLTYDQLRMIPRGECEGSENIVSPANNLMHRSSHCSVSFEELLGDNEDTNGYETDSILESSVKDELSRCQSQVKHLSALLRESESNSERLTQLCEALKEEIRRVERDNERKEHLKENTEYLKNVILKFVTLQGEDERLRLIPVFRTMLKLAPTEVESLEMSVKKGRPEPLHQMHKEGHVGGVGGGWSSYIPRWNSGGT